MPVNLYTIRVTTSQILRNIGDISPAYTGELRQVDEQQFKREEIIRLALNSYGHLIPLMTSFRIDNLGMLIHQALDQENSRNRSLDNSCLLNRDVYGPFQRLAKGTFRQL